MTVKYGLSCDADDQYRGKLYSIAQSIAGGKICEIGGGANPALPIELVQAFDIDYTIVDVSESELAKAPEGYHKVCTDVTQADHGLKGPFDLVFSFWCAEHVSDGKAFHQNIFDLLPEGGQALHLFPTLYAPPFVLNRMIPEWVSEKLLLWLQPHRAPEGDHGKFPARYSWCRGPSKRQLKRFTDLGYSIEEYAAFFGHSGKVAYGAGYLDRIPPLCWLHEKISKWLSKWPNPLLTAYAFVHLSRGQQKPVTPEKKEQQPQEKELVAIG